MDRKMRDAVLDETKECVKTITELTINSMVDCKLEDEENLLLIKMLRLSNQLMDYVEFQSKQFDHIEDQIDALYELVQKGEKKEA